MKKLISLIIAVALCFALAIPSFALTADDEMVIGLDSLMSSANLHDDVYDFADTLMPSDEEYLSGLSTGMYNSLGFNVIFITVDDTYGVDTTTFVTDFYDYYLASGNSNVVIFTVDFANNVVNGRQIGDVESKITNDEMGTILDKACDTSDSFDAFSFFEECVGESIVAYNGELSDNSDNYTTSNGYSYSYMAPFLDLMMDEANKYDYVYDFAGILSDSEEKQLSKLAKTKMDESGLYVAYLTYSDAYGRSTMDFTDDFYDYYISKFVENGSGNDVDGLLFAVDMDNREVYINTAGTIAGKISSSKAYDLLDKTYQYASDGDYFKCFEKTTDVTFDYLYPNPWMPTKASLIAAAIVAVVLPLILFAIHNKSNKVPKASEYLATFSVLSKNDTFLGHREEVIHDFYKQQSSGGGGGHSSGGGGSHGGGGHGF
ncbi:MAG: TPM domain-containing protein [Clostridia bacterium]|nr:TPM domain-containing protein [Clostridia bacterium]